MKKGLLNILAIISFLVAFFMLPRSTYALKFSIEKSIDTIKPGQDVTIAIKASDIGADSIGEYNISLGYDAGKLDFKSGDGNGVSKVTPASPISITHAAGTLTDGSTVATIVFSAKNSAGDVNLTLSSSGCYAISDTEKKNEIKATNNNSMIKVVNYSSDATLSSLKIPNATISPKFDKNVTEYKTTIQDITEITVNAIASDQNAKIMISDNYKNLQKGDNDIKIVVTAEDGKTSKTYMVKVTLKLTPTDEEILKASASLKNLTIEGYDIEFLKELKKYSLTVPYKITKLNIKPEPENANATVNMQGNTNLKVGRNTVRIQVTSEDQQNKEEYTINVTRSAQKKKVVQTCPDTTSKNEWIIFSICMILTFTMGIILGYFLCKKEVLNKLFKRKKKQEEIDEKLSDTIKIEKQRKK